MAQDRTTLRASPAIQRRPAVSNSVQRNAESPRSSTRVLQERFGNRGAQRFAAQALARSSAPGAPSAGVTSAGALSISHPDDAHEREADRMADQVMRMPEPKSLSAVPPARQTIQRGCVECEGEVQRQPLAPLPVAHEKPQLVDVNVESFLELAGAARRPSTKRVFIVGSGLEYFKNHDTSQEIRRDFFLMLELKVKNQKTNSGNLTGTYRAGLRSYGSIYTSLFSKGTWMVGKTDEPKIDYVATYSKVSVDSWNVAFKAKWKIIDDFDFRPEKDKSMIYKTFAWPFGGLWHDVAGGKEDVPVHIQWEEGGSFMIQPALPPTVTTYGTTPTPGK
jgi:hypothetical protein